MNSRRVLCIVLLALFAISARAQQPWIRCGGPEGGKVNAICDDGKALYVATDDYGSGDIFRSSDEGEHWVSVGENVPNNDPVWAIVKVDSLLFIGTNQGLYRSSNEGQSWVEMATAISIGRVGSLQVLKNGPTTEIIAITYNEGLIHSFNGGRSWSSMGLILPQKCLIENVVRSGTTILAATNGFGVYRTSNDGDIWEASNDGIPAGEELVTKNLILFHGKVYVATLRAVYVSEDLGVHWTLANEGLPPQIGADEFATDGVNLYANLYNYGAYKTTDEGMRWEAVNIPRSPHLMTHSLFYHNSRFYVGFSRSGLQRTTVNDSTWEPCSHGISNTTVLTFRPLDTTQTRFVACMHYPDRGIAWATSDHAQTWAPLSIADQTIHDVARHHNHLYAGTDGNGLFRSSDDGLHWNAVTTLPSDDSYITSLLSTPAALLVSFSGSAVGVARSMDDGENWQIGLGLSAAPTRLYYDAPAKRVYALCTVGISTSEDDGISWTAIPYFNQIPMRDIVRVGNTLYGAGRTGLYSSSDDGSTWSLLADSVLSKAQLQCLATRGDTVYVGTGNEVLYKPASKELWTSLGRGLPRATTIMTMLPVGDTMYVGTESFGVWKIALASGSAGVSQHSSCEGIGFEISQRAGVLHYSSTARHETTLQIFDMTGRSLLQLQHLGNSGTLSQPALHSGLYFIRLTEQNGTTEVVRLLIP